MRIIETISSTTPTIVSSKSTSQSESYLNKCQVDTPPAVVDAVWAMLKKHRENFGNVVDYGAGDGRFATGGKYETYIGYEIDKARLPLKDLPYNAVIKNECALASGDNCFDLCIGNPPFVRHHDIDKAWYENVCNKLEKDLGFRLDRRSNAFLLFFAKALISTKNDGLVALVIPFEWVSRPASRTLREYIKANRWEVKSYRFTDDIFPNVMTTASLTIVDKSNKNGEWSYFDINKNFEVKKKKYVSGDAEVLEYIKRSSENYAQRGLSPGGQEIFCLTEGQRIHNRLIKHVDVVPCVTTMRHWNTDIKSLTEHQFEKLYINTGMKCWLLKTWEQPSLQLMRYLEAISLADRDNYTCNQRSIWWKIAEHKPAEILYSSAFVGTGPKFLLNQIGAVAVGSIQGIHNVKKNHRRLLRDELANINFNARVVAHSGRLRKIEVGQMNKIVSDSVKKIISEK